ncbi:MAG: hypothetical protein FWD70_00450 [Desulfuromonadales bacterium]|nr:hypothetical protein [Desulfuromonadales bacterium]
MNSYRIVLAGKLSEGTDAETAIIQFMKLTRIDRTKAEKLLTSGNSIVIKKNIDKETGEKIINALTKIGVDAILIDEPSPKFEAALPIDNFENEPSVQTPPTVGNLTNAENTRVPFRPPAYIPSSSNLTSKSGSGSSAEFRIVPAGNAIRWFEAAFKMFFEEPWRWPLMFIIVTAIYLVIGFVFGSIPGPGALFGTLFSYAIGQTSLGAIMIAASTQQDSLKIGNLLLVFQRKWRELWRVGAFQCIISLIVATVMVILFFILAPKFDPHNHKEVVAAILAVLLANPVIVIIFLLTAFIIKILCLMAFYFAPALITLRNRDALESVRISFKAVLRNWAAFVIAGIIITLFLIAIFGIIVGITIATHGSSTLLPILYLALILLILPLSIVISPVIYTSFEDIFYIE